MSGTKTTIELPEGASKVVTSLIKRSAPRLSASVKRVGRNKVEVSSSLPEDVLMRISLLYPNALIRELSHGKENTLSAQKIRWIRGIIRCPNKNCVTAQPREPTRPEFRLVSMRPLKVQCSYCGRYADEETVLAQLIS